MDLKESDLSLKTWTLLPMKRSSGFSLRLGEKTTDMSPLY